MMFDRTEMLPKIALVLAEHDGGELPFLDTVNKIMDVIEEEKKKSELV